MSNVNIVHDAPVHPPAVRACTHSGLATHSLQISRLKGGEVEPLENMNIYKNIFFISIQHYNIDQLVCLVK